MKHSEFITKMVALENAIGKTHDTVMNSGDIYHSMILMSFVMCFDRVKYYCENKSSITIEAGLAYNITKAWYDAGQYLAKESGEFVWWKFPPGPSHKIKAFFEDCEARGYKQHDDFFVLGVDDSSVFIMEHKFFSIPHAAAAINNHYGLNDHGGYWGFLRNTITTDNQMVIKMGHQ